VDGIPLVVGYIKVFSVSSKGSKLPLFTKNPRRVLLGNLKGGYVSIEQH
jgi:hypothetical protein